MSSNIIISKLLAPLQGVNQLNIDLFMNIKHAPKL